MLRASIVKGALPDLRVCFRLPLKACRSKYEVNILYLCQRADPAYAIRPRILSQACGETIPEEYCKGYCALVVMILHPMLGGP